MANRHTNKKLRSLVRRRMAETGESHQEALHALLAAQAVHGRESADRDAVDLVLASYFGFPVTFAVFGATEPVGRPVILRVPSSREWVTGSSMRVPVPMSSFRPAGRQ